MKEKSLSNKLASATKWLTLSVISAKLVSPITNMVLARLISPEAFGVVATVTMIVSFADMLTDAGFQNYLVQYNFKSEEDKFLNANVAFWTNFCISIFLWLMISMFRNQIALAVGNPGLGFVVAIACIQLPLTSFSSIQMALYRREFDFKTLFHVRLIAILIPFTVTIPLAYLGLSYWSMIIGSLSIQISNAILLTIKSSWKPRMFYSIKVLKKMLSFSIWSLVEAISIWFTAWADVFIIGSYLNQYYLGIYKTSTSLVNTLLALITSSVVPVLFSALSRLQKDELAFSRMYLSTQKLVAMLVFPLGIGMYVFSDLATSILLGSKWIEASYVIGLWSLTGSIVIVLGHFCSEVYRAKGLPKLSFLAQMMHLIVLVPACIYASEFGFTILVTVRAWVRMELILVHFILMHFIIKISILKTLVNLIPLAFASLSMGLLGYYLKHMSSNVLWSFLVIIICIVFYFSILVIIPSTRQEIRDIIKKMRIA